MFVLFLKTLTVKNEKNTQSNHMLYVYLYLYTKHFSRLHSKAYICCVKIGGSKLLLRMALSFPRCIGVLDTRSAECERNVCSKTRSSINAVKHQNQRSVEIRIFSAIMFFCVFQRAADTTYFRCILYAFYFKTKKFFCFESFDFTQSVVFRAFTPFGHILILISPLSQKNKKH